MSAHLRFRLGIAYDGTGFRGWAHQPGLRTVQGVLEEALATLFHRVGGTPMLTVAGRTDAGVHASGQVAHLDLSEAHLIELARARGSQGVSQEELLLRRMSSLLARETDVVIRDVALAPTGFDARFSAVWRRYRYRVADADALKDPLERHRTVWHPRALDADVMSIACSGLLGLGDFAAFCKPRPEATTIRTLQQFSWQRDERGVLVASLQADAFCHSMVRSLIGASIAVGEGRLTSDALAALLEKKERSNAFVVQAAKGLDLVEVGYPASSELADRAELTRARRVRAD